MGRYFASKVGPLGGFLFALIVTFSGGAVAQPFLAFSDLVSGPSTGLGDGRGSGVVVTVWGQNLGPSQGDSEILFRSANGETLRPAHVYYWKNADGKLPSGPANLYESHRMQEIAFSIPEAPNGQGEIVVKVDGVTSNVLPFTVRSGNIYHVKSNGNNSNSGSWSEPFATADYAVNAVPSGSTIYIHDVDTGNVSNPKDRAIYWNNGGATSSLDSQFGTVAFPGYQPKVIAQRAIESYRTEGWVVSKLDVYASNYLSVDGNGQPTGNPISTSPRATYGILTSKNGRVVANRIGDIPGGCASQAQGAILGNKAWVGNNKLYGNEVYDYGCEGSNKLHHTTYMSIRSGDGLKVEPWEWAYNYLHGNKAKFGIHNYDEGDGCGDMTGPLIIHGNVIIDQGGAGISVGSACGWSMDAYIENNILINVGLAAAWDGIDPTTTLGPENGGIAIRDASLTGTFHVRNNLIYHWSVDNQNKGGEGCLTFNSGGDNVSVVWSKNICYSEKALPFIGAGFRADNKLDNVEGSNNIWHISGASSDSVSAPTWDSNAVLADPMVTVSEAKVFVDPKSPAFTQASNTSLSLSMSAMSVGELVTTDTDSSVRDIYGNVRPSSGSMIGPITIQGAAPNPPSSVVVEK